MCRLTSVETVPRDIGTALVAATWPAWLQQVPGPLRQDVDN